MTEDGHGSLMRYMPNPGQNYPHVVVFRVPRLYVDVNRYLEGENAIAEESATAEAAWKEYHDVIDHVQKMVLQQRQRQQKKERQWEPVSKQQRMEGSWAVPVETEAASSTGLLLDIHGHVHATNLIEIGYLLSGSVLAMDDRQLNAHASSLAKESSVRSLISRTVQGSSMDPSKRGEEEDMNKRIQLSTFLRGWNESLGGMFQTQGLNAVPSPEFEAPCHECIFFFGGYTIQRHGSRDREGWMDAIQLELPRILRIVNKEEGREIGMRLGRAVVEYLAKYYGVFEDRVGGAREVEEEAKGEWSRLRALRLQRGHRSEVDVRRSVQSPLQQRQHSHMGRRGSRENHSGDSDVDDERGGDTSPSASISISISSSSSSSSSSSNSGSDDSRPEMKRQSSRL
ncbi:hypothetical protein BGZ54_001489 [Gamsiella multidivaricata]|nr:hypothetical protein BGZ54_001489 [Gamsiella multidivaricata]